jgi:biopolymer transport protein ExbD
MLLPTEPMDLLEEKSEINVTPFIDVMLVLLIVFMVAAPLSTVTMDIELPSSGAEDEVRDEEKLVLVFDEYLALRFIDEANFVERNELKARLDVLTAKDRSKIIYIQADKRIAYGDLMILFDDLRLAGYLNVSLVGAIPDQQEGA